MNHRVSQQKVDHDGVAANDCVVTNDPVMIVGRSGQ